MAFAIALSDEQWELVADLFDPPGRRGAPALIARRDMVDAMLFVGRTAASGATCRSDTVRGPRCGPSGGAGVRTASGSGR